MLFLAIIVIGFYIYGILFTVEVTSTEETVKTPESFSVESQHLKLILETTSNEKTMLTVIDKSSEAAYSTTIFYPFKRAETTDRNLTATFYWWFNRYNFTATFLLDEMRPEMIIEIRMPPTAEMHPKLASLIFPPPFNSSSKDFIVLPYAEGIIFPSTDWRFPDEFPYFSYKITMGWAGVTDLNKGYMIILDTPFDAGFKVQAPSSSSYMSISPVIYGQKGHFSYPRKFTYVFISEGGYVAMAKRYREFVERRGYVKTLQEKRKENENIDKLIGAVDLWTLSKDLQTEEFFKSLKLFGIDRAIVSLGGGWIPPVGLSKLIDQINDLGYLTGHYDIYTDVWNPSDNPPEWARTEGFPEDVIVLWNGELCKGWVIRVGLRRYQGYYLCSKTHYKVAEKRIAQDLALNNYTARFIDVETASPLWECYNPDHPTTREEDAQARLELLKLVKSFGLVVGSEEAREWAFVTTDYGEGTMTIKAAPNAGYDWMRPVNNPGQEYFELNADGVYRVPLRSLVYHDVHVATWYTGDGATKVPSAWIKKDLLNILYGTMPLWMPVNLEFWNKYRSDFLKSYQNVGAIFRQVGYDEMVKHEFLTSDRKVQRTEFSSGTQIVVNFGESEFHYEDWILPSNGFIAIGKDWLAYRAIKNGHIINEVVVPWKSFLDSGGIHYRGYQLETDGAVVVEKLDDKSLRASFLDDAGTYVSINISSFLKDVPSNLLKVYPIKDDLEIDFNQPIQTNVDNGWLEFKRLDGVNIYYICLEM